MKVRRIPLEDIVTLAKIVVLEDEEDEGSENPFDTGGPPSGTYAMDSVGRVWRWEETISGLFQEFLDIPRERRPKRNA